MKRCGTLRSSSPIPQVWNISGGRSSGYMFRRLLDAHSGVVPPHCHPIFCNTGKERAETLDFVRDMELRWGCPITWLEYHHNPTAAGGRKDPIHTYKRVDYDTASRMGEPFDQLIRSRGDYLPNPYQRICTQELKVNTINRYLFHEHRIGKGKRDNITRLHYLGLRADEPRRYMRRLNDPGIEMPLVQARITKREVDAFWANQAFDLQIESWESNCDLCFLKGAKILLRTMAKVPTAVDWWIEKEDQAASASAERFRNTTMSQFSKQRSYRELKEIIRTQPELELIDETYPDCFCTD